MTDFAKVFVYGTLKKGFANHHLLEDAMGVKFVTEGYTKEAFPLVVGTNSFTPFMLPLRGEGKQIHGEIYEVNADVLQSLDELEGHPTWYKRENCEIVTMPTGTMTCFAYFLSNFPKQFLSHSFLSEFSQECNQLYSMNRRNKSVSYLKSQSQDN